MLESQHQNTDAYIAIEGWATLFGIRNSCRRDYIIVYCPRREDNNNYDATL